jgi:hypothetical protein
VYSFPLIVIVFLCGSPFFGCCIFHASVCAFCLVPV